MICLSLKSLSAPTSICAATNILISFVEESSGEGTWGKKQEREGGWWEKKTHRILTQKPEMHSEHTSPHISWLGKKMEFKETKIIKTFFVLEKKEFGFSPKDRTKNQILFSNRRLMPMHSKKPKPAATTATHLPLQFSPLSLEKKKKKQKHNHWTSYQ